MIILDQSFHYNFNNIEFASNYEFLDMKWHHSFTRKFTIMNYSKLIKNLKRELIKYPITRNGQNKNNQE